ncbi:M55 family metallopeptidase [Candidatus Sumerlaeota bacterium]|nr:M55 family metallopeptidase [Candidatus Sumerlaeota bacterium]
MRVQMWCDMEGVAGITQWAQVSYDKPQYAEGQRLYTDEINAAVRGAKRAGATEIIVVDGHGAGGPCTFNSWIKDRLEPGAEYVTGYRWGCYVEAMKQGCDAMFLPGAHAMAGTPDGVLCHTMSSEAWINAYMNDVLVGESGIVASIAGSFDVPVVFVSGDTATCKEVAAYVGKTVTQAEVKKGLGRFSARNLAPADACALIEQKAYEALSNPKRWPKPVKLKSPVEFKVELAAPDQSIQYTNKKGLEILAPRLVVSRAKTAWQAWDQFWRHH